MIVSFEKISPSASAEFGRIVLLCVLLVLPFTFLVNIIGKETYIVAVFGVIPILLLLLFSLQTMMYVMIGSLFIHALFYYVAPGAWCAGLFLMSFVLTQREIHLDELRNPLSAAFLIYCMTIIPSFINAAAPLTNVALLHNLFILAALIHIIPVSFVRPESIRKSLYAYLLFILLNSFTVIVQALVTGKRAFGFAGIMFVDYAGTGLIVVTIFALTSKGTRSFLFSLLAGIFLTALLLTQTRGAWLVTGLTLTLMLLYFFFSRQGVWHQQGNRQALVDLGNRASPCPSASLAEFWR